MTTKMRQETLESAAVVHAQWEKNSKLRQEMVKVWRDFNPYSFVTIARGSSDHAAQYFNYLASLELGKLTTSLTPSLITLHKTKLDCSRSISVAISQSGKSPDLIAPIEAFNASGGETLALVNVEDSPLAKAAKHLYPLHAGDEISVAATKSYIASLYASASLIASASNNKELQSALPKLSESLNKPVAPWSSMLETLKDAKQAMIVGRGLGFSIALEAALKLKETSHIQAEAFSAAEIKHGPQAVIEAGYPLIIFALRGPTQAAMLDLGAEMRARGAKVMIVSDKDSDCLYQSAPHSDLDPLCAIHSFYLMAEELTRTRGLDPDNPRSLSKVTMTL